VLKTPGFIRDMKPGEEDAVERLLLAAFETDAEARLVRKLRKANAIAGETVLPMGDDIIGYFALLKMVKPKGWLALAPVAIDPEFHRQGFGKRMLGMLTEWAKITSTPVVVLGNPVFYERCGFDRSAVAKLSGPCPIEFTMLVGVDGTPEEELIYPAAFNGV